MALVVFSIGALSLTYAMTQTADNQIQLENRTLAMWVARNALTELRLAKLPSPSDKTSTHEYASRQWSVSTKIQAIDVPFLGPMLRQVTIDIALKERPDQVLQTLRAVLGQN